MKATLVAAAATYLAAVLVITYTTSIAPQPLPLATLLTPRASPAPPSPTAFPSASTPPMRKLLRRTADGKKISDRFCALDAQNKCDWVGYAMFLVAVIVPMLVFAGLALVCAPLLACLRMCGCLGGRKPRPGLCCGHGKEPKLYSKQVITMTKAFTALMVFACFITLICAYVGNGRVSKGVSGVWDAFINSARTVTTRVQTISDTLGSLPYTSSSSAAFSEAADAAASFVRDMDSVKVVIVRYELYRALAANFSLLVPFLFLLGALVLGMLNKRGCCIHVVLATLIMASLSLVWFSTAIHSLFAIVFDDACDEFGSFIDGSNPNNIIDTIVGCSSTSGIASGFRGLEDEARSGLSQAETAACDGLTPSCAVAASPQLNNCPPGACDSTTLPGYRDATWSPSPATNNAPLTVADCATQCTSGSTEQSRSAAALVNIADVETYDNVLTTEILPLLSCDFLGTLVRDLFASFCKKLTSGLVLVSRSQIAMAVFLFLGLIGLWLGQKRFLHHSDSKEEAHILIDGDTYDPPPGDPELELYAAPAYPNDPPAYDEK